MLDPYLPLVLLFVLAGGVRAVLGDGRAATSGPRRYNRAKLDAYECGIEPSPQPVVGGGRMPVAYYLTAMLFILFDIEMVFLYPFAVTADALGLFGLVEIVLFIVDGRLRLRLRVAARRAGLELREATWDSRRHLPNGVLLASVEKLVNWTRKSSLWPATFGLACCAIEMMTTGGPALRPRPLRHGGLPRLAAPGRPDDRRRPGEQQDGPGAAPDLRPDARAALGARDGRVRQSGGMFNNYAIVQGVDHVVPVDMYLPGCPPRPEMLIDAILKLHAKIMDEPLGAKRAAALARVRATRPS